MFCVVVTKVFFLYIFFIFFLDDNENQTAHVNRRLGDF